MSLLAAFSATESDQPVEKWHAPIDAETVRRLSILRTWPPVAAITLEWTLIAAGIAASMALWNWNHIAGAFGYVAAVIWIGSRQHALAILMHEAAHYRLFRKRAVNDILGELLCGWPLLISMRIYRRLHFAHHRSPNTADDPDWMLRLSRDWIFPKTRWDLCRIFLIDLFGLHVADQLRFFGRYAFSKDQEKSWLDAAAVVFFGGLIAVLTYFHWWLLFLAFWVVPLMTWLKVVLRLRTIAEHYGVEYDHVCRQTRTTYPSFFERWLFAPWDIGYHLDHHLYPSVPFYNLKRLHAELLKDEQFRTQAHLTDTYAGVLRECRTCGALPAAMMVGRASSSPRPAVSPPT